MPANLNRKQQREIKAVVERAKKDNGIPQTAQQSIPFQRMFPDGICRVTDSYYSKTIQFQDINYQLAQQEDKTAIFDEWCSFLNFFDSSIHFELSFMNLSTDAESFEKSIRIPFKKDSFNPVRAEYSQMLKKQLAQGNNGSALKPNPCGRQSRDSTISKTICSITFGVWVSLPLP